jgi:hypothetical protein
MFASTDDRRLRSQLLAGTSRSPVRGSWGKYPTVRVIVPLAGWASPDKILASVVYLFPRTGGKLCKPRLLTVCAGCNLCRAHAAYVNIGSCIRDQQEMITEAVATNRARSHA